MKLQTKKVIAREFLILLFTFFISAIVYFSIYPYNYFKKENINKILKKVSNNEKIADSLIAIFKLKNEEQLSFHQKLYEYIYLADHSNVSAGLGNIDKKKDFFDDIEMYSFETYQYIEKNKPIYLRNENLIEFDTSLNYLVKIAKIKVHSDNSFSNFGSFIKIFHIQSFKNYLINYLITPKDISNKNEAKEIRVNNKKLLEQAHNLKIDIFSIDDQIHFSFIVFVIISLILFAIRYIYYSIKWSLSVLKNNS